MGNVKDLQRKIIIAAASNFLSDQEEGDLYDAYLKLLEESDMGNDDCLAADYINVWQPLEHMTVASMIKTIEDALITPELPEFMKKIDWKLLQGQKAILLVVINELNDPAKMEGLEGILGLLDSLQDSAVDDFGLQENIVFSQDEEIEIQTGIKDHSGNQLKTGDKTIARMLCAGCNSDNLDLLRKYPINKKEVWCNDCEDFHPAYEGIFKNRRIKVEGFQVISDDNGGNIHPDMAGSFCLYSLKQARKMLVKGTNSLTSWRLLTMWTGDVEEPTKMFKGQPRK